MEISKKWEYITDTEKHTKLYNILKNISVNWSMVGKGDFSPHHTLFNCCISDNKNNNYLFTYQCNLQYTKPTENGLLACVLSDAECYKYNKTEDEDETIENFAMEFGYNNDIKGLLKAYKGCKKAYKYINKWFTEEEQKFLREYFESIGEI